MSQRAHHYLGRRGWPPGAPRLSALASEHGLAVGTLWSRLERGLSVERALATGIVTRDAAGRRATLISPWSAGFWPHTATGGPGPKP